MRNRTSLTGQKIGCWLVGKKVEPTPKSGVRYECICSCGTNRHVERANLVKGTTKSCGCERRRKLKLTTEDKNHNWKGNNVGYTALHGWIRSRMPHKNICEQCKKTCSPDLANISQKYIRDLSDWEWLCRKCHMEKDGRLKKLHNRVEKPPIVCPRCERTRKHCALGLCKSCYSNLKKGEGPLDITKLKPIRKSHNFRLY